MRYRYSAAENGKPEKKAVIYTQNEHGIDIADVDIEAINIIRKLKNNGFETYIVGGAVRDLLLGKKPKDFDIVSAASPARIKKLFRNSRIIGRRFRLVHIFFGQRVFEVSTFRSLKDGHTSNTFGSIEEDVLRRDFTLNALFYDPAQQIVVDYIGGFDDIKKKRIKPIIPLSEIFKDDPVRMIRAVKYAAMSGFSLPFNMRMKIKKQSPLLASISPSRLTEEIFKIIHSSAADKIVISLYELGLYNYIQPNAAELMKKNPEFKRRYLKSLSLLTGTEKYRGQALGALFYDYLETAQKWEPGVIESGKSVFILARPFVLPMNPPKFEMRYAIRKFLSLHGIKIARPLPKPDGEKKPVKKRRRKNKTAK